MIYYVIMVNDFPEFIEVDKERADIARSKLQKRLDLQDGVKTNWERKRIVHVCTCEGAVLQPSAKEDTRELKIINAEVIVCESKDH